MHDAPDLVDGWIGKRFHLPLRVALPHFEEPFLDLGRLDRQGRKMSPTGNDALDEVSLVGFYSGKLLGACRIRLVDPQLVLNIMLTKLTKRPRSSPKGL